MPDLAESIAASRHSGYIVAPAGYGKTHLIAQSVAYGTSRQLILTHTYAGVNALRTKLRTLNVSTRLYRIDTIASWALRVALAFSKTSNWLLEVPKNEQWADLYEATVRLVQQGFMLKMLRESYGGVFVDEYQDCSEAQHRLVLAISKTLPVRFLGDPMQGIFDFSGAPVDWSRDIERHFPALGALDIPHRWINAGAPELGAWLKHVRSKLESGSPISLTFGLPQQVTVRITNADQMVVCASNACRYHPLLGRESAVAIFGGGPQAKNRCHSLARQLGGRFSSIEEIEGRSLYSAVRKLEASKTNQARLKALIAFAADCLTNVTASLPATAARGELTAIRANTRNPELAKAANAYVTDACSSNASRFLARLKETDGVSIARGDLFNRMLSVLRKQTVNPGVSLTQAAAKYQTEFRYSGRPVGYRLIGTTLLLKGLQFEHAIVLDAGALTKKEAYVALTRGAKSLTIVSHTTSLAFA